jgi:hypothetical protein
MNANLRIKLIKIFSILKRHVEINKWKAFYYILNYGKGDREGMDVSMMVRNRLGMDRSGIAESTPFRQTLDLADFSRVTVTEVDIPSPSQSAGLRIIEKIFNKKLENSVKRWRDHTMIETKLNRLH